MNGEPEGNQNPFLSNSGPDSGRSSIKNFFKSKSVVLIAVLGMAFVLIIAIKPARSSAGVFLASFVGLFQSTFTPNEVMIGEIPLGQIASSTTDKPKSVTAVPKTTISVKTTATVDAKDKEIAALNDKINALQAQLSNISSTIPAAAAPTVNPTSTQNQNQPAAQQSQVQTQTPVQQIQVQNTNPTGAGRVLVSEIMAGADGNGNYEFIELYNAGSAAVDLTGWSIKKKSSSGSESSLVAVSRFSGKIIQPSKYLLLGNETGYQGSVSLDVAWPSSYTLAYTNNSIVVYNNGAKVEEVFWAEIPKGESFVRTSWNGSQFVLSESPTPQNSSF